MASFKIFSLLTFIYVLFIINGTEASNEEFGYETVRTDAHMFWWLIKANASNNPTNDYRSYPLIIWLQGGPGGSSTGFGNFEEIGPLDVNLNPRNTSWNNYANLLFIDNPVGTGYSYVSNTNAYSKTNKQISLDLVTLLTSVLQKLPEFQTIPLYIFCESYGGKMTTGFAVELHQAIRNKQIECNFHGIALGDSWISPIDSVATWGQYLYSLSFIDGHEKQQIEVNVEKIREALSAGQYEKATSLWSKTEGLIESLTDGVNFYNVLQTSSQQKYKESKLFAQTFSLNLANESSLFQRIFKRLEPLHQDDLYTLMNGVIKNKLKIPSNVVWSGQSAQVFTELRKDFMLPVVDQIDYLLNSTSLKVVVYTGQLDLIVDTMGTLQWMNKLKWSGIKSFENTSKTMIPDQTGGVAAFYKSYKSLSLYWIMKAGHMVPSDAGETALQMVKKIIGTEKHQ